MQEIRRNHKYGPETTSPLQHSAINLLNLAMYFINATTFFCSKWPAKRIPKPSSLWKIEFQSTEFFETHQRNLQLQKPKSFQGILPGTPSFRWKECAEFCYAKHQILKSFLALHDHSNSTYKAEPDFNLNWSLLSFSESPRRNLQLK